MPVQLARVILLRTPFAADIRGHRQVVRHQLPKLTLAGSSPVARSMNERGPSNGALLCLGTLHGLEPRGRETEEMREHFPASVRGCEAPEAADSRSEYASPVARSMNEMGPSNGALLCLGTLHGTPSTVGLLTIQRNIAGIRACQAGSRYHYPIRAISISSFLHPTSHEENHEFIAGDRARIRAARLRPSWQRPQPQHPHTRSAEKNPVRYQSLRTALHD